MAAHRTRVWALAAACRSALFDYGEPSVREKPGPSLFFAYNGARAELIAERELRIGTETRRRRFYITGQVQGVGFRPFVYRLATQGALAGWVINDARGVTIEAQGPPAQLDEFARRLRDELPPLAQAARFAHEEIPAEEGPAAFEIRASAGGEVADAQITVDTAVCADCLREMNDPADPRYRYPFINCTNCGPRYTIVTGTPYDRPNTTMVDFPLCPLCRREYADPACRRFHAQPIACPQCGPSVWLTDPRGVRIECADAIVRAAEFLAGGKIVAIKGLGGFHLACRADDEHVVRRLRQRKRRDAKPFALMVSGLEVARALCEVTDEAAELLTGAIRPIVVLPAKSRRHGGRCLPPCEIGRRVSDSPEAAGQRPAAEDMAANDGRHAALAIAPSVAQGLKTLGIMLPYTPLHYLLFQHPAMRGLPLVMTSGNYSEEPLVKDNDAAVAHMGRIADALLLHDRRIARRVDDSVVQLSGDGALISLRRARGYAPQPVRLEGLGLEGNEGGTPSPRISVLAVGGELKSTVCLLKGGRAVLSEHVGDMKDGRVYRHWIDTIHHLETLFEIEPAILAADLHPRYLSTEYALKRQRGELAGKARLDRPVVRVQHHYAHIAACLAENGYAGRAIGLACDGTGYGEDGAVWGCEVFEADLLTCTRLGHLRYIRLPGGDLAAAETFRPALSALHEAFGDECLEVARRIGLAAKPEQVRAAMESLRTGVNCPASSSLGRWFDAAAAMTGVAGSNDFEGQAPMILESAIELPVAASYPFRITDERAPVADDGEHGGKRRSPCHEQAGGGGRAHFEIDLRPMVVAMARELSQAPDRRAAAGEVAAKFHNTVAEFLLAAARRVRERTGLGVVALSGGCFANRYLVAHLVPALAADGFRVLRHRTTPCSDGSVALGQAVIAAARALECGGIVPEARDTALDR